jgi:hypothetical protein
VTAERGELVGGASAPPSARLTPAQERTLAEVRLAGERRYDGRARRAVEALEAAGLVVVEREGSALIVRPAPEPPCDQDASAYRR